MPRMSCRARRSTHSRCGARTGCCDSWAAVALGAQVVAVAVYRWYAPPIAGPDPIGAFRSMGLDLTTLVAPTQYVWGADLLGRASDHTQLWGDGTNSTYNYVGVLCAVLA